VTIETSFGTLGINHEITIPEATKHDLMAPTSGTRARLIVRMPLKNNFLVHDYECNLGVPDPLKNRAAAAHFGMDVE